MIIKPLKQIVSRINPETGKETAPKHQGEKQYLLLLYYNDGNATGQEKSFEIITGRNDAFKHIFDELDSIDLLQSHVMSQTVALEKAITAYTFLRFCLEEHMSEQEKDEIEFNEDSLEEHMLNFYELTEEQLNELYTTELNQ